MYISKKIVDILYQIDDFKKVDEMGVDEVGVDAGLAIDRSI